MISIISLSKEVISQIEGMDSSIVTFESDEDIVAWKIKLGGTSHDSGVLIDELRLDFAYYDSESVGDWDSKTVGEMSKIDSGVDISCEIFATDLNEGNNRLNVYGLDLADNWDLYTP